MAKLISHYQSLCHQASPINCPAEIPLQAIPGNDISLVKRIYDIQPQQPTKRVKLTPVYRINYEKKLLRKQELLNRFSNQTKMKFLGFWSLILAFQTEMHLTSDSLFLLKTLYSINSEAYEILTSNFPLLQKIDYDLQIRYSQKSYEIFGLEWHQLTYKQKSFIRLLPIIEDPLTTSNNPSQDLFSFSNKEDYLDALTKVIFSDNQITIIDLKILLEFAPNIRELQLTKCHKILPLDFSFLNNESLSKLTKVHLQELSITWLDLISLFQAAPNIQELTIDNCPNILNGDYTLLSPYSLPGLCKLVFINMYLTQAGINSILKCTNKLTILHILNCKTQTNHFVSINLVMGLAALKEISFSSSAFSFIELENLAKAAPNLRTLTFSKFTTNEGPRDIRHVFLNLIGICIVGKISCSQLLTLSYFAPYLQKIVFFELISISQNDQLYFSSFHFNKLNHIVFRNCKITQENIQAFQQIAPNVITYELISDN